jgi:hypothetical protein
MNNSKNSKIMLIGNNYYKVVISKHVLLRIEERGINPLGIIPSIRSAGNDLEKFNCSGRDIIIIDIRAGYSMIIHIFNHVITVMTVIDKAEDVYVNSSTDVIYLHQVA